MSHARDRTEHDWVEEDTTGFDNHCRWCYHCSQTISTFFAFPWGRESFLKTISCMKPPEFVKNKCKDHVATLIRKLRQDSFRVQGFPRSLQLVAFPAIPELFFTNEQLTEMVIQLKTQMKQLHQLIKRKKKRSHGCACNGDDELPESQSPIISKYAAQLHRHSTKTRPKPLVSPTNDSPPPISLVVSSPIANPIIHTPIVHDSLDHPSPTFHTSPEHSAESDHVSPIYITTIHHPPADTEMITTNQNFSTNHPSDDLEQTPTPVTLRLLLLPQPITPLTSPTKSNDTLSGFAVHAGTINAFQPTTSSNSPPCICSCVVVNEEQQSEDLVDQGICNIHHTLPSDIYPGYLGGIQAI
ncbi:hypothetical protein Bca101_074926 [Brassica carinata]